MHIFAVSHFFLFFISFKAQACANGDSRQRQEQEEEEKWEEGRAGGEAERSDNTRDFNLYSRTPSGQLGGLSE